MDQNELLQKAERYLPGVCLGMMHLPPELRMVMVRGAGSKIYDAAGKEYLDYVLGSGPLLLGHGRPEVIEAVQRQVAAGSTFFALNEPAVRLAEMLVKAIPCGEAVRFQTTGSEATFAALRLARAATGRDKILKFEGGWHGGHDLGQLSSAPAEPPPFPAAMPDCDGIPHAFRQDVLVAPFNDLATTEAILSQHHDELAAVIVEPLQRVLRPEPEFLQGLRSLTRKHGIVLIFDEIVTGFRLAWGGAQERYGVVPDLACYGKVIGGGYPLSAVVGKNELLGLAQGLRQAGVHAGVPLQVLGDGPVLQVFFAQRSSLRNHRDLLSANRKQALAFGYELIRRGIYCTPGGKLYLSLAHSEADLEHAVTAAGEVLEGLVR